MKPALFALVLALAGCSATPRSATPQPLVFADWTDRGEPWAACVVDLKRQLRDPDSYQDDWAEPTPKINDAARTVTYRWTFRARNGFGGYNAGRATCTNTLPAGASDPFGDARARVID